MISKKTKALTAGILSAVMSATAVIPAMSSAANEYATENGANESYAKMFASLYDDVMTNGVENGYLSKQNNGGDSFGIPYHAVETLCVEAPDYGHETTSEAMSYISWVAAMHDILVNNGTIEGSSGDLAKAWKTMEAIIPGWSNASGRSDIRYSSIWQQQRLKADTAEEKDTPNEYPTNNVGVDAENPLYEAYKSAYGSDNGYYLMHWLADVDDWYGFGGGSGKFTFINTFQRGEQESCFETVPHPCLEELKYGNQQDGIKGIFNGVGNVAKQYAFTNAPDAEDRAIQAVYFANQFGAENSEVTALAGKMGDQCRNDMFDKYYHEIGCQDIKATGTSHQLGDKGGQHYLMAWYTSWGGALDNYDWAWQIGASHSHQFYQNPLAAYALIDDKGMASAMKASGAVEDYRESFKRQIEMYLWLQSVEGPFAGGCTNSYRGRYEKYPDGYPTFYNMVYVPHPVYADPGSNHWTGNQVWPMQRLTELYYYVKTNGESEAVKGLTYGGLTLEEALKALIERWVAWFEDNMKFDYVTDDGVEMAYAMPSSLDWGDSDTDYSVVPDTWDGKYDPNGNQKLHCTITGYGMGDVGCISSLCNTLIYYAKAEGVDGKFATDENGTTTAEKGLYLANKLLSTQWNLGRDEIGIAFEDHNGNLKRIFEEEVYIPANYHGTMPDGSKLENGATFSTIRESYANDPMYQAAKAEYDATKSTDGYYYKLHRFWHHGDALMSYGSMALLYPEVKPLDTENPDQPTTDDKSDADKDKILWGDANVDSEVTLADAVLIMQSLSNPDTYSLTDQGKLNADVVDNGESGITTADALAIQCVGISLIKQADLPVKGDVLNGLK
ncbi:MAG: cellulose 1,4-beta-cellobiosidase [Ruminococcus sp.]|nr:cellulose 1,4-beta-cellobiosidase [Ruminococcus sp.]MDE6798359.1 cellulose 1,4-beta-cellobiosidase [Ruminococcus sp.]